MCRVWHSKIAVHYFYVIMVTCHQKQYPTLASSLRQKVQLSLSLSLSHTHVSDVRTWTHSLSLPLSFSVSLSLSISLSLSPFLAFSHFLSLHLSFLHVCCVALQKTKVFFNPLLYQNFKCECPFSVCCRRMRGTSQLGWPLSVEPSGDRTVECWRCAGCAVFSSMSVSVLHAHHMGIPLQYNK